MRFRIGNRPDFWSGAVFIVVGAGFAWGATGYNFGDAAQPGAGYFPFGLGVLLALLGVLVLANALAEQPDGEIPIGPWAWKPLIFLCGAVVLFGWTLPTLGLFVALPLVVVISALAGDEFHWGEALVNATILTLGCWALFSWGLKLTIPLLPWLIGK